MFLCKIFRPWILLSLTVAWLPGRSIAAPTASDRANILFIAIDDLNDWVGFLEGLRGVRPVIRVFLVREL